jgi:signal transduction histidine kinase/ligand-binding sensor domain-containing protein
MNHRRVSLTFYLICCLTILLLCKSRSHAQAGQLKFERFTTEKGLASNVVYCILQDKKGWLWIGTNGGLSRYDGYSFRSYRSHPGDSSTLPSNDVQSLCEDEDGNLWVATSKGVCRFNSLTNSFSRVSLVNDLAPGKMLLLNKETLLIYTGRALVVFNPRSLKSRILRCSQQYDSYEHENIITIDNKGYFYVTMVNKDTTVILRSRLDEPFTELLRIQGMGKEIGNGRIFYVDRRNQWWIGTTREGNLFHCAPTAEPQFNPANFLVKKGIGNINQIFEDKDGKIWIATAKGLFKYDYHTDSLSEILYHPTPGATNTTLTMSVFQDRNGLLWIGGYNGLFKINPTAAQFSHLRVGPHQMGLKDNFILGIYASADNKAWINYHWGVKSFSLLDPSKGSIHHYNFEERELRTFIRESLVQNPQYIDDNALQGWINKVLPNLPAFPFFLVFDQKKNLWTSQGGSLRKNSENSSWQFNTVVMDEKISGSDIWFATDGEGLHCFNTKTGAHTLYVFRAGVNSLSTDHLTCLLTEENGSMWIGTKGNGLEYFDRQKNKFVHYTTKEGLNNNSVYSLVKDHRGRLWIGTANGLSCLDITTGAFKNFYRSDGLVNSEYNRYSACRLPNDLILMGGLDGIDYFHPDNILKIPVKPITQITDFKVFNRSVFPYDRIRLEHDQNYVTIDFTSMDFLDPANNQYEYKLEGIDKDWINAGTQHSVSYATLAPGRYRFVVRAVGNDGIRSEVPAEIEFLIITPWWKTMAFYIALAFFMLTVIFLLYKYRIRQLKRLIQLRTKISQDLHDDVGATLSGIRVFSQLAKDRPGNTVEYLNKITNYSDDMLNKLNDIVWSLNPENDSSEQLMQKLRSYAEAMTAAKNIRLEFFIDPAIQKSVLTQISAKNIYMITREAINNAIKYAHCSVLQISLNPGTQGADLVIKDDGKGFDKNDITPGNGLSNMYKRAEEMYGILEIESSPGMGTTIRLSLKFT